MSGRVPVRAEALYLPTRHAELALRPAPRGRMVASGERLRDYVPCSVQFKNPGDKNVLFL